MTVSTGNGVVNVFLNGAEVQPVTQGQDTIAPTTTGSLSPAANAGWNNSNVAVTLNAADNAGGSGVNKITYSPSGAQPISPTVVNGSSAMFTISASGVSTISFYAQDNAGNVETARSLTVRIDRTAPAILCGSARSQWSGVNVTISCTASDTGGSGLANPAGSSFTRATNVANGSETANALTGTRVVCDVAGNCATAGPVAGVDRKAPAIVINAPSSGTYLLNQTVAANFSCSDGGSGVATCQGTIANGSKLDTSAVGSKAFTVTAADSVANSTSQSVTYTIAYNVCLQYDPSTAAPAGSVVPIRIKLCDAKAIDMGSRNITVTAVNVSPFGGAASPGNSNSGGMFTFLEAGGYQFLLDTSGYTPGAYALNFVATGDPTTHQALFQLK